MTLDPSPSGSGAIPKDRLSDCAPAARLVAGRDLCGGVVNRALSQAGDILGCTTYVEAERYWTLLGDAVDTLRLNPYLGLRRRCRWPSLQAWESRETSLLRTAARRSNKSLACPCRLHQSLLESAQMSEGMKVFNAPDTAFRTAVTALNAGDWRSDAATCDPGSLAAFSARCWNSSSHRSRGVR